MKRLHKSVYLKRPTLEELAYTEALLADPDTMAFNDKWGGTVSFPKEKWPSFFERYCTLKSEREYFHVYNLDNVFVGEVSTRFDEQFDSYVLNIKIMYRYRGNHHAMDALSLFLDYLFEERNIERIVDNVARDNNAAITFLKRAGFKEIERNKEIVLMELTKEQYFTI